MVFVLSRLGNRLALVPAQRLDRKPGQPQIGRSHGLGGLGEGHGDAVVGPEHLGGALRGKLQGLLVGIPSVGGGGRISPKRDKVARLVPPELIPAFLEALVKSTRVLAGSRTQTKRTATSSLP